MDFLYSAKENEPWMTESDPKGGAAVAVRAKRGTDIESNAVLFSYMTGMQGEV